MRTIIAGQEKIYAKLNRETKRFELVWTFARGDTGPLEWTEIPVNPNLIPGLIEILQTIQKLSTMT